MSGIRSADRRHRPPAGTARSARRSSRAISAGVIDGSPSASRESPWITFVSTSQTTGSPSARTASIRNSRSRLRCTSSTKPGRPCARWRQIGSNCGEASKPDSSGCRIHISPSPSRSRSALTAAWWATIRGSSAGSPTATRHANASAGGWIVAVIDVVVMDHVVEQPSRAADRVLPEDRVTDEPVRPRRGEQRLELGAGARRVEMAPRDRREARVPVPLPAGVEDHELRSSERSGRACQAR